MGKLFTTDWNGVIDGISMMYFRDQTHWQATRIVLASRIYAVEHGGKLAPSLKDLASASYLGQMPLDPYSGAPFRYDPKRKIVWSVGQDGRDDGGKDAPGSSATGKDMVYAIDPPLPVGKAKVLR